MSAVFIARISYIFPNGLERHLSPGEYFHFRVPLNKAFLWTHLASVLPAGLLAVTQFVPRIRARAMSFHRNAGKAINVLTFISTFSAVGIAHVSFGGDLSIQSGGYALALMTLWSTVKSWTAIRRLQVDKHREWIIRSWSYQMSVITLRAISILLMIFISASGASFYHVIPCEDVAYVLSDQEVYTRDFPQCQTSWTGSPVNHVSVRAGIDNELAATAGIRAVFGASTWGGLWLNAVMYA
ncbi:hypothetical protein FRC09_004730 [Ceratobasidium sp. 395]|nr:hypothetical protein FRC09_004730 [Ceratobasidium sp. 395]